MSFSKKVEHMVKLGQLHKYPHMNFMTVTVEPLPTIKEYGEAMPEEDRLDFAKACMKSIIYHKARGEVME